MVSITKSLVKLYVGDNKTNNHRIKSYSRPKMLVIKKVNFFQNFIRVFLKSPHFSIVTIADQQKNLAGSTRFGGGEACSIRWCGDLWVSDHQTRNVGLDR